MRSGAVPVADMSVNGRRGRCWGVAGLGACSVALCVIALAVAACGVTGHDVNDQGQPAETRPGMTVGSGSQPGAWVELGRGSDGPPARGYCGMTYDSDMDMVILFGGYDGAADLADTWTWDPDTSLWTLVTVAGTVPSARDGHSMAYDPTTRRVVLFGGLENDSGTLLNDSWTYDPGAHEWRELKPDGVIPSPRMGQSLVYDPVHNRLLLFGGMQEGEESNAWAYYPATNRWQQLESDGAVRHGRWFHSAVCDPANGKVFVYGGISEEEDNDLWAYDLESCTWTELAASENGPSPRFSQSMTLDSRLGRLLVFGGWEGDLPKRPLRDLWAYDLEAKTWTNLGQAGPVPEARASHGMVEDPVRHRLLLFGGVGDNAVLGDTWAYNMQP
jgi:hypothetical protein